MSAGGFVNGAILRVSVGEADRVDGTPVYERILLEAKKAGLMGAAVYRGIESFGQDGKTHTARILRLSEDLPLVVEIADEQAKIESFMPVVVDLIERSGGGGLITTHQAMLRQVPSKK
ncbi:MAG: DUF190 domain-containing protein [Nitrospinae bacterium]|nr:DUF190 domain-containing protein [Nitrospinota bacterium]MBF0635035.1 DUF190 domain-containing protein [Nitrospinota bacterium]